MKKLFILLTVILLSIALFTACANNEKDIPTEKKLEESEKENSTENDGVKENEEEVREGIFPGNKAPDFTLVDREGNEIGLSDLENKVIFLNFWASWCPPCKAEMPYIQNIHEKYKDTDVAVITVNLTVSEKNGVKDVNKYIDENKYTFPVLLDTEGIVATKYAIRNIPTTYIINKEGIITNRIEGPLSEERMIKQIEDAMK